VYEVEGLVLCKRGGGSSPLGRIEKPETITQVCGSASRKVRGASPADRNVQASADVGADVQVRPRDRALAVGVPVLATSRRMRMRTAQLCRVGEFELLQNVRSVVGADDDVFARDAPQQPHGSAAIVLDGLGRRPTSVQHEAGASSRRASRQGCRLCRSRPPSDAARTPRRSYPGTCARSHRLAAPTPRDSARGFRVNSGSHCKPLLGERIGRADRLLTFTAGEYAGDVHQSADCGSLVIAY
jgi:hypothetical protein